MESLERKDTIPGLEEPIKSEEMVPSPSTSDRSNGAGSPPPNCSICLGKLINTSFTDSCLHKFCFTCLLQWSKIKTECPLCKQTFKSIIHNVRAEGDYDQYDVNHQVVAAAATATLDVAINLPHSPAQQWGMEIRSINIANSARNFMYRTTMYPHMRRQNPLLNAEAVARREQIPAHLPQVPREEARRRINDPSTFRQQVYSRGIWATELPDTFGGFRECSAAYYRLNPGETHRLVPWLNRELQVLLNNNRSHTAYVLKMITDNIVRFDINSPEFRNTVRPYFGIHTDQFVHEFLNFARANFDMVGYDQSVVYQTTQPRGLSNIHVQRLISPSSSSLDSDSDSDVRLVEDDDITNRRTGMNTMSVGPHMIDMPGPSSVGHALRIAIPIIPPQPPVIYTISSSSSESENECEVIGYVKPRHERTPEIIDLDSESEAILPGPSTSQENVVIDVPVVEEEIVVAGPSTEIDLNVDAETHQFVDEASRCCLFEYFSSTSENEDDDESDSDYNPRSKSRRHKKKSSKSSPKKAHSRKHKKSTSSPRKRDKSRKAANKSKDSEYDMELTDMPSTSRGTKRYISDESDTEKPTKKSKKSKKTKSPKKSKKSSKAKTPKYIEYSSCSSSMSSESENEYRLKKKEDEYEFNVDNEEQEETKYTESENLSQLELRFEESDQSSDGEEDEEDGYDFSKRTIKSIVAAASTRDSQSSDSDEHSASTKISKSRSRSHKKRKESKKRRRSRS